VTWPARYGPNGPLVGRLASLSAGVSPDAQVGDRVLDLRCDTGELTWPLAAQLVGVTRVGTAAGRHGIGTTPYLASAAAPPSPPVVAGCLLVGPSSVPCPADGVWHSVLRLLAFRSDDESFADQGVLGSDRRSDRGRIF
jgi:hypothetical protein